MGTFWEDVYVSDGNGGPEIQVNVLVDTGASYTILPGSLVRNQIGVEPKRHAEFTLADGSKNILPVGEARFAAGGEEAFSPVVFGAEGRYLLGAVTLQSLGLIADTTNHRLIPAPLYICDH